MPEWLKAHDWKLWVWLKGYGSNRIEGSNPSLRQIYFCDGQPMANESGLWRPFWWTLWSNLTRPSAGLHFHNNGLKRALVFD
jgi:hypothetical protein